MRPGQVNRVPAWLAGLQQGAFTRVGWQVTLCDPVWQVALRSSAVGVVLRMRVQKHPADMSVICPVCGDKSSGPLTELPRNSFIQKLIRLNDIASAAVTGSRGPACDVCGQHDDLATTSGQQTPSVATHYCTNCAESLCGRPGERSGTCCSAASIMHLRPPRTPLGQLTALPRPLFGGSLPLPKNPFPLSVFGLEFRPLRPRSALPTQLCSFLNFCTRF